MSDTWMRPRPAPHRGSKTSHLFLDMDSYYPWRVAACGREVEDSLLTEPAEQTRPCRICLSVIAKEGVS